MKSLIRLLLPLTLLLAAAQAFAAEIPLRKTSETDGNGHAIAYEWDAIGRQKSRTQQTAAGPATTSTIYDAAGNPVTVTDPNGNATHTDYDERNRPVKVYDSLGTISQTTYDKVGNPLGVSTSTGTLSSLRSSMRIALMSNSVVSGVGSIRMSRSLLSVSRP